MPWSAYLSLFLLGLMGGAHCGAMCGGFVVVLSRQTSRGTPPSLMHLAYSTGRVSSYVAMGTLVAAFAGLSVHWFDVHVVQLMLYVMANFLLIVAGVSLAGRGAPVMWLEGLGGTLWRALQPLTSFVFPANTLGRAIGAGLLWGWLPCGLVYSALGVAMLSASAGEGAVLMLAFGMGTLPAILGFGLFSTRIFFRQSVRQSCGAVIVLLGVAGLVHASGILGTEIQGILCHF